MESLTLLQQVSAAFFAQSLLEVIAVITAILYLVLAIKENKWCWFFGFISTGIYVYLFYDKALLSESLLNIYYLIMAVYGWLQWSNNNNATALKITKLPLIFHAKIILACAFLTPFVGYLMQKLGASFPYVDAFVAMLSVVATLMTAKKIYENWYYWLFINIILIYLFWQKQMYLTALLFMVYIVLVFVGIKNWKNLMAKQ